LGVIWLVAASSTLVIWASLILFRIFMPSGIFLQKWIPGGISTDVIKLQLSTGSWVFAFLLVSLLCAIIFTETIRLGEDNLLISWTGSMIITAVGLLAIQSQTFLAVVITWTLIDIVEIGILVRLLSQEKVQNAALVEFSLRVVGSLLIIAAMALTRSGDLTIESSALTGPAFLLVTLGAFLRLGVLPLHLSFTSSLPIKRGLGTLLRFISPLTVFTFLIQIGAPQQFSIVYKVIFLLSLVTTIYGAVMLFLSKGSITGRPYWMLFTSGLLLILFLRGETESIIALGIIMIVGGGLVFLNSSEFRYKILFFSALFVSLAGFPYSPTMPLWQGLLGSPLEGINFLIILATVTLFAGIYRNLHNVDNAPLVSEKWMRFFYGIGLGILFISPWITLVWRFSIVRLVSYWWAPVCCLVFITLIFIFNKLKLGSIVFVNLTIRRISSIAKTIGNLIGEVFRFEWLAEILSAIYSIVLRVVQMLITALEGDGCLLWSLLFLVLITSVILGDKIP
jgi:hypothetical protein